MSFHEFFVKWVENIVSLTLDKSSGYFT